MTKIEVTAPSRLHFGMFSFGRTDVRQYGGVGVMIDQPGIRLRISPAERFTVDGPLGHRTGKLLARFAEFLGLPQPPTCRVEVLAAPREHLGLGTGTQFDLAVAAGLNAYLGGTPLDAMGLVRLTGRGVRSAIGTYGFLQGGLLVESGKHGEEPLAPLERRIALPSAWRWVLIFPNSRHGLAGHEEHLAFRKLPPVPHETTAALREEVASRLLPAAEHGDFEAFGESVYAFGRLAGECFAPSQGGAFASGRVAQLVENVRDLGVRGVGQSSWGPTVFAVVEGEQQARAFGAALAPFLEPGETWLATATNADGARIGQVDAQ